MNSFHRGDWLSLAQAVAAILAIIGAFVVVFLQHHLERKREAEAEAEKLKKTQFLAAWTVRKLHKIIVELVGVNEKAYIEAFGNLATERVRDIRSAMAALPASDLNVEQATALFAARDASNMLISVIHIGLTRLDKDRAGPYLHEQFTNLSTLVGTHVDAFEGVAQAEAK